MLRVKGGRGVLRGPGQSVGPAWASVAQVPDLLSKAQAFRDRLNKRSALTRDHDIRENRDRTGLAALDTRYNHHDPDGCNQLGVPLTNLYKLHNGIEDPPPVPHPRFLMVIALMDEVYSAKGAAVNSAQAHRVQHRAIVLGSRLTPRTARNPKP